ncbi:MAG: TIGR03809 family protein [Bradyrhizobium sp.]|nr:TIGR03809 family protein [Pseudomonadota bacterium]MDE2067406.1 TIGR03809 family protein [Bradyrhizobium sp.]MDE2244045.1 TIGR03809 family protein [Bradyrhizobium sp.]MDE2467363.1 TIGR03809 family protein [Bradyrhizobium sp.]
MARGRDVLARWRNLAEQRLEYLTELFESGRWRRFHTEAAFLENIREAKSAVETWRDLSMREASPDNSAVDVSWLGRAGKTPARNRAQSKRASSQPIRFPAELTTKMYSVVAIDALAFEPDLPALELTPGPARDNAAEPARDVVSIQERYPLLRNAL